MVGIRRAGEWPLEEKVASMDDDMTRGTGLAELAEIAGTPRDQFFLDAYCRPPLAVGYAMTHALRAAFPGKALIETNNGMFDVEGYAEAGQCTFTRLASPPP
jgi:hypothetical protein